MGQAEYMTEGQDIIWEEGKNIRQKDSKRFRRIAEYIR
jgi:hypothetical protein